MRYIKFIAIAIVLLIVGCKENNQNGHRSKELVIVNQDYNSALQLAAKENKLLFIDFYTTWCGPCKKLDKVVFENDSIKSILGKEFVMLKYNAEQDTIFHLSKKHHVSSYPTGIILNNEGFVVNRKYGFSGTDASSIQNEVIEFTDESIALNQENKLLKGYSNSINAEKYPKFYVDFVNRTNTKINNSELSDYLNGTQDKFSEAYFSTLLFFARDASEDIAAMVLKNKQKYMELYGEQDVEILLYFLSSVKFNKAIAALDQAKYNEAVKFTKKALSDEWVNDVLPNYKKEYLKAQNKWDEIYNINKKLKEKGEFNNESVNHFSKQVYTHCDDQDVIKNCLEWMKEVTTEEPTYAYLKTYTHLLYKAGNTKETRQIANLTIEAAKKEDKSTKELEALLDKL